MASCPSECKTRSLSEILIAAASTAVFIAAANFGFAPNISSKAGIWQRWFQCLKMALGEPFRAFAHSLISAAVLWHTLRSKIYEPTAPATGATHGRLQKIRQEVAHSGLVAIMLNCPILIQIPPEFLVTTSEEQSTSKVKDSAPAWMKDVKTISDIKAWCPLELPPAHEPAGAGADDHHHDVEGQPAAAAPPGPLYIKLHPSVWGFKGIDERTLLLKWKLVPEYEQLRYLRARSTFEAVVTTVQSLGYMLGVAQRIGMPHAISPLEAILAFFNLLIVLQFILNLYCCVHYQRPLLLSLSLQQFKIYSDAHSTNNTPSNDATSSTTTNVSTNNTPSNDATSSTTTKAKVTRALVLGIGIGSLISVALYAIIQLAFIEYALSFLHHHRRRCILCSVSAFLVCLLALSALILIALFGIPGFRKFWKGLDKKVKVNIAFRICTGIISTASTILALVATIRSWDEFKEPTSSLLHWIVPYVNG